MEHRGFFRVIGHKLRHRPDLIIGLLVLTVGSALLVGLGSAPLGPVCQVLLIVVGVGPIVAVVLGMFYDYADLDSSARTEDLLDGRHL